jgi:hypothetical protein
MAKLGVDDKPFQTRPLTSEELKIKVSQLNPGQKTVFDTVVQDIGHKIAT